MSSFICFSKEATELLLQIVSDILQRQSQQKSSALSSAEMFQ